MEARHLLLAEDDDMLAQLLHFKLAKEGFAVHHCSDGKQVKEQLAQQVPDIIVTDIMMPYFSGIELVDHVRNHMGLSLPIIIISAAGNEVNVLNAFDLGANDFVAKPFSPSELLVRIAKELKKV
ncbi:response regulator transcription factor [Maribacter sp. 2307ULW6-5]|uniref:response regulator transcription factor n=1 Tax=Maribacter sp. 2307ULW6-5 TaxID=3386275 RepID=UPI0039BD07D7